MADTNSTSLISSIFESDAMKPVRKAEADLYEAKARAAKAEAFTDFIERVSTSDILSEILGDPKKLESFSNLYEKATR